jgi:hypothetical protein
LFFTLFSTFLKKKKEKQKKRVGKKKNSWKKKKGSISRETCSVSV